MATTCDTEPNYYVKYTESQAELRQMRRELRSCQGKLRQKRRESQFVSHRQTADFLEKNSKKVAALKSLNEDLTQKLAEADARQSELKRHIVVLESGETHARLMGILVTEAGLAPVLAAADKVEELNREIMKVAGFLADNVQHMVHEIFRAEVERSYRNCERTLGPVLTGLIGSATQEDANENVPPDNFLVQVVAQIFMVAFCLSHLDNCRVVNGAGTAVAYKSWDQVIINPPTQSNVKSKFLQGLTDIFKVASWAILGREARDAFEATLPPFLDALDSLNTNGNTLRDANFDLCAAEANRPFMPMMYSETPLDVPETDMDDTQYVAGTMVFGLRKRVHDGNANESQFKSLLHTQVVLYSTLQEKYGLQVPEGILEGYPESHPENEGIMNEVVETKPKPENLSPSKYTL